jgi:RpiB/LacA/LacB family sugar-phosphate isomerase
MKIAVGSDSAQHIGGVVVAHLRGKGIDVLPCGALAGEKADYVDSGRAVAEKVAAGECDLGILLCNTGTGASIVANKVPGVRAAIGYPGLQTTPTSLCSPCASAATCWRVKSSTNGWPLFLPLNPTG